MLLPIQSVVVDIFYFILGPPSATLSCVQLSGNTSGTVNVTVSWTLSVADSTDFYLISITTNSPQTPYGGLLNITTASVTQYELTGFMRGYEYNITVRGVNCGSQEGRQSEPLTITPQGMYSVRVLVNRETNRNGSHTHKKTSSLQAHHTACIFSCAKVCFHPQQC